MGIFRDSGIRAIESGREYAQCLCGWYEPVGAVVCHNASHEGNLRRWPEGSPSVKKEQHVRPFDQAIANIDRALSELMIEAKKEQDAPDTATLRHHAGDLVLSGAAILRRLKRFNDVFEYLPELATERKTTVPATHLAERVQCTYCGGWIMTVQTHISTLKPSCSNKECVEKQLNESYSGRRQKQAPRADNKPSLKTHGYQHSASCYGDCHGADGEPTCAGEWMERYHDPTQPTTKKWGDAEDAQQMANDYRRGMQGKLYRHYKGGAYRVLDVEVDEETGKTRVTYQSVSKEWHWSRTIENFFEQVRTPDGLVARFEKMS
jgi:hypothetical protein